MNWEQFKRMGELLYKGELKPISIEEIGLDPVCILEKIGSAHPMPHLSESKLTRFMDGWKHHNQSWEYSERYDVYNVLSQIGTRPLLEQQPSGFFKLLCGYEGTIHTLRPEYLEKYIKVLGDRMNEIRSQLSLERRLYYSHKMADAVINNWVITMQKEHAAPLSPRLFRQPKSMIAVYAGDLK